jgi:hypothetical protein
MYTAAAKSKKLMIKLTADAPRKIKSNFERALASDSVAVVSAGDTCRVFVIFRFLWFD